MKLAKILIVEDEDPLVTLLTYNLEAEGYEVASTKTGDDAIVSVKDEQPDLIILDWMLPGLSGIDHPGAGDGAPAGVLLGLCERCMYGDDSRNGAERDRGRSH